MAEENVAQNLPQDEATVTDVTDDALSSAWDATQGVTQETAEEIEAQPEAGEQDAQIPDEPTDNAERSRLGRRIKGVEETLNRIQQMLESGQKGSTVQEAPRQDTISYDDSYIEQQMNLAVEQGIIPETIITPLDQVKVNNFLVSLEQKSNLEYQKGYINALKSSEVRGNTSDNLHDEVVAELFKVDSPYNRKLHGKPLIDAKINYLEAKSAILEGKATNPTAQSVFKGKSNGVPTGTHVSTRIHQSGEELPPLDEASLQFIKSQGMSEESVKKALKEPMPLHLKGRF